MTKTLEALELAAKAAIAEGIPMGKFRQIAGAVMTDVAATQCDGNQCHAAKLIGVHRNTFRANWAIVLKRDISTVQAEPSTTRNLSTSITYIDP